MSTFLDATGGAKEPLGVHEQIDAPALEFGRLLIAEGISAVKLNARYVSIDDFDDLYFEVLFENQRPAADYDPSAPTEPYLLLQRQFEDEDCGVCYLETHDPDHFAGHFRLRLIEFTPTRLAFDIDRPEDRVVEVTYKLSIRRFREVQRIVHIIFGVKP